MSGRCLTSLGIAVALALGGCASYDALPLSPRAVETAITPPTGEALQQRIVALNNPLIRATRFDPSTAMTPEDAAVVAVVCNPTLRAVRDRQQVIDAEAVQAGLLPNPTLSFGLDVPIGSNSGGTLPGYGLGVDWEITSLLTLQSKIDAARQASEQGRLDIAWQEWQIAEGARLAAYDVLALRQQLADAEALAKRLEAIAGKLNAALEHHDITAADASAASAAADEATVTVVTTQRDLRDAELAFNRSIGFPPETPVQLLDSSDAPATNLPATADLIDRLPVHRFDLVALRRGYDSQDAAVRGAILGQFPKISLGLSHTRDYGDFLTLGPALTIDLPIFDRNQGNIAIARATRQQLFDEYVGRLFEARSDVARAVAAIHAIDDLIVATERQVKTLRRLVDTDEKALGGGNLDIATFYTAAISLSQKQTDLAKLRQDLTHARITLELAAGVDLSNLPNIPSTQPANEHNQ